MRQAGRYLPEYRELRAEAGSFLDLCLNPEMAAEITMQPIRRYKFDAAILFADILLIPMIMGQALSFEKGEGPKLQPALHYEPDFEFERPDTKTGLSPIFETIKKVKAQLSKDTALIGFAGAPWTVATYMIAGQGVKDPAALRSFFYQNEKQFRSLMSRLEQLTTEYLIEQIKAGAQAIQLFESWAQGLPPEFMQEFSINPLCRISSRLRRQFPETPIIIFPRGAQTMLADYADCPDITALSLDYSVKPEWVRDSIDKKIVIQGGLDPLLLLQGGRPMRKAAEKYLEIFSDRPYIFNLGHGLVPEIPPENVADLIYIVRSYKG